MKSYAYQIVLLFALILTSFYLFGCATIGDPNLTPQQKAEIILQEDGELIKATVGLMTRGAVQYCEENPEKRESIKDELRRVAGAVSALAEGNLDGGGLTTALKVKEKYIQELLNAIVPVYRAGYERLNRIGEAKLAVQYLKLIADGVKAGAE